MFFSQSCPWGKLPSPLSISPFWDGPSMAVLPWWQSLYIVLINLGSRQAFTYFWCCWQRTVGREVQYICMVGVSFDKDFFPSPLSTEYKKSSKGQVIELKKKKMTIQQGWVTQKLAYVFVWCRVSIITCAQFWMYSFHCLRNCCWAHLPLWLGILWYGLITPNS